MMRFGTVLLLALARLSAQPACPAIGFKSVIETIAYQPSGVNSVFGLHRQLDGSLTQVSYRSSNYTRLSSTPNYQNEIFRCSGLGERRPNAIPFTPFADTPGTMSRNPVVAALHANGTVYAAIALISKQLWLHPYDPASATAPRTVYAIEEGAESMIAADFNGDGKRDIAVIHNRDPGLVSILLGNGDGTLQAATTYELGKYPRYATAYDFNGDGRADLAVASVFTDQVSVLMANPAGGFAPPVHYPAQTIPTGVIAADVDGDGKADLVATLQSELLFLKGNGDGAFQAGVKIATSFTPRYLSAGDLNNDGKLDLAVTDNAAAMLVVMMGAGDGTFPTRRAYALQFDSQGTFITDFDRDGKLDIVVAGGHPDGMSGTVFQNEIMSVLIGNGDGTFHGAPGYNVGSSPTDFAAADFNGDGRTDFAVNSLGGSLTLLLGQAGGSFTHGPDVAVKDQFQSSVSLARLIAADVNGDGKQDLIGTSDSGQQRVWIVLGNGDGTFQAAANVVAGTSPSALAAADLDADGKMDLVVGQGRVSGAANVNSINILFGNGNGTFQTPLSIQTGTLPANVAIGDVNGDGKPDVIVANAGEFSSETNPGNMAILLNNGARVFQNPVHYSAGINPARITLGDVNGDGKIDIVFPATEPNFAFRVGLLLGKGDGTFQPLQTLTTDFFPNDVLIRDFNNDGKADLIVSHCCGDTDSTFFVGNGDGTFQPEVHFSVGANPQRLHAADFDGNGSPDIAVVNNVSAGNGFVTILLNLLGGTVEPQCAFSASRNLFSVSALGDVAALTVTASSGSCQWEVQSAAPWITVSPAASTGSGQSRLTIAANPGPPRTGTVTAAGVTLTVLQGGTGCSFTLAPQTATIASGGGQQQASVNTAAGCAWTPAPSPDWTTIPGGTNPIVGPGAFTYSVAANNGTSARTGSISIGGQVLQILQQAANPAQVFTDVPLAYLFANYIDLMKGFGITSGCTATTYCPDNNTTRGEMAVFIIRGVLGTDTFNYPQTPYFTDVPAGHPFFKFIQKMRELGITSGCTADTYCPDVLVTRGQMAVFIIRARLAISSGVAFPYTAAPFFTDVPEAHPFFAFIQKMRELGITSGCSATSYCVDDPTTRGQMAVFIIRGLKTP